MSRIGRQIIAIPEKVTVTINDGLLVVKGPKGELQREFKPVVTVNVNGSEVTLTPHRDDIETNALWGTYSSHVQNMIKGVVEPYVVKLILEGIGFKAEVAGTMLNLALGFSHPVKVAIPAGITMTSEKGAITITGIDKELVTQFAATLRSMKKPEPYKGKGFRYEKEVIRRKQGKKTA
ncbi:MAG: 50S ribosomal protein L6 [bacterium]